MDVVFSSPDKFDQWVVALKAAAAEARRRRPNGKIGYTGFSLGGNLVLNAALKSPVTCVIDYFGPVDSFRLGTMPNAMRLTKTRVQKLPPLLIHQGTKDAVVPKEQSEALDRWCKENGKPECTLMTYKDSGHPDPAGSWKDEDNKNALNYSITFLQKWLK